MRLLAEDFEDDIRNPEIENPMATTWVISFIYTRAHDTVATDILAMMSMFNTQAVPESLLSIDDACLIPKESLGILEAFSRITL